MSYPQLESFEEKIVKWTDEIVRLSLEYEKERKAFGEAKANLNILLAGQIIGFMDKKKNLGIDLSYELLMATDPTKENEKIYRAMVVHENNYKALEKIIEAYNSKTMSLQSIMRYYREGDQR